ncbi:MAG: S41 family peptidase [Candidatus Delongbacteria bacterium]|nr:S41 family peptidase [Candidatus Delongbacteria bacterium]
MRSNAMIAMVIMNLIVLISCSEILVDDQITRSPVQNFEVFWQEFDRQYAYFEYKKIDWDSVYRTYRPQIGDEMSDAQLFDILRRICRSLRDCHVSLQTPMGTYIYWNDRPLSSPTGNWLGLSFIREHYLVDDYNHYNLIHYGTIRDTRIVYVLIGSFAGPKSYYYVIDNIVHDYQDYDGMIIDVRENSGGSTSNSDIISSRFADQKRIAYKYRYRNGPGHDDFTDWDNATIVPGGKTVFLKPIVLLTNRDCASSTEDFILQMRSLPHVTMLGDTTAGSSGNPLMKELPNGWIYGISNWQEVRPDMSYYETIGLAPDHQVWISVEDSTAGRDRILEAAVELLQSNHAN